MLTLITIVVGILVAGGPLFGVELPAENARSLIQLALYLTGAALVLGIPLMYTIALWPLQRAERMLSPRVIELFQHDGGLRRVAATLFGFVLLTFIILLLPLSGVFHFVFAAWFVFFGVALDNLLGSYRNLCSFLNPYAVIDRYVAEAKRGLRDGDLLASLTWIEALTEVCIRAVEEGSLTITDPALKGIQQIMDEYLDQLKAKEGAAMEARELHAAQYPFFDFIEKMQCVYELALAHRFTLVAEQVVKLLGKVTVHLADASPHLMTLPVRHMAELTLDSGHGLDRSLVILQETLRASLERLARSEVVATEGLAAIVKRMHDLSNALFKQDKELPIPLLMQPFTDVKALLSEERFVGRPDCAAALEQCEAALEEFSALSTVMEKLSPQAPQGEADEQT